MKKVLLTWELGMGLGHLHPIRALAQNFIDHGFTVYIASRDLRHCDSVFKNMAVKLLQSPFSHSETGDGHPDIHAFAQILGRNGYFHAHELLSLTQAWQSIFELVDPDFIIAEHSPTALLANRGSSRPIVHIGTGFTVPPHTRPLAPFTKLKDEKHIDLITQYESHIVKNCNTVLRARGQPQLRQLADLYSKVHSEVLLSLPELDHFAHLRKTAVYLGITKGENGGNEPIWPKCSGKKIFVYLKPFDKLPVLLSELRKMDASVIFYSNDIDPQYLKNFSSANIRFETQPLDLVRVSEQADLAITNGNHNTLAHFIRNRVGIMMIPLHWEQKLMTDRLQAQNIGLSTNKHSDAEIIDHLKQSIKVSACSLSQHQMAQKYKFFNDHKVQNDFFYNLIQDHENNSTPL